MIIMFAGRRKTGKTAVAEAMMGLNFGFKVCSFADALKTDFSDVYKVPLSELYDVDLKEFYRADLIEHASEKRAKNRYYFANLLFEMLDDDPWIIDDLRTVEELEVGLRRGAAPWKVYADNFTRRDRGWKYTPHVDEHFTETEMDLSQETFRELGGGWFWNNDNDSRALRHRAFDFLTKRL